MYYVMNSPITDMQYVCIYELFDNNFVVGESCNKNFYLKMEKIWVQRSCIWKLELHNPREMEEVEYFNQ